jgi:2-keto-4-pentenoate hydratase
MLDAPTRVVAVEQLRAAEQLASAIFPMAHTYPGFDLTDVQHAQSRTIDRKVRSASGVAGRQAGPSSR